MRTIKTPNNREVPEDFVYTCAIWHFCMSLAAELSTEMELNADTTLLKMAMDEKDPSKRREMCCSIINDWDNKIDDQFILGRESFYENMKKVLLKSSKKFLR